MKLNYRWLIVILCMVCLPLTACGQANPVASSDTKTIEIERLESETEPTREILTPEAVQRLDIQTAPVRQVEVKGIMRAVVPYGSILYDNRGTTWTYTNPEPQTYVRHMVTVDDIDGEDAILSSNDLPQGMHVVIRGAEELFGAEFEFQEE